MKKTLLQASFTLAAATLAAVALVQFGDATAHARPQYSKAFAAEYPDFQVDKDSRCNVCHVGMDKKKRNDYGAAVGKALGAKNVKDAGAVKTGLETAAGEKSNVDGKTWGELIKENKLPITK